MTRPNESKRGKKAIFEPPNANDAVPNVRFQIRKMIPSRTITLFCSSSGIRIASASAFV